MNDALLLNVVDDALTYCPTNLGHVQIHAEWYCSGVQVGPDISYFDVSGGRIKDGLAVDKRSSINRRLEMFFGDNSLENHGILLQDGATANYFMMRIWPNRKYELDIRCDRDLDRRRQELLRAELSPAEFDEYLRETEEYLARRRQRMDRKAGEISEHKPLVLRESDERPTPPQLFSAIVQQVQQDAPADWQELVIDGEVWTEPNAQGKPQTHIDAHFWARTADGQLRQVNPKNVFGPMNALQALQGCWFKDDGTPWRRIRITFAQGASSVDVDYEQPGPPPATA
ncbi:hypothetical protein V4F39_17225 [Aquincola sp. MAHUQ-54]|uniref:Uncharacterized protein n=1 Tax=Aquincola agrisoli TaxID=3119538 RepID=A0AAW9QEN9_9BURK